MAALIPLSVIWLGFSAVVVQVILLREMFSLFSGNELVTGIVFGNWLLLTAAGSFMARYSSSTPRPAFWQSLLLAVLSLIAPLELIAMRSCRLFMDTGLVLGFDQAFLLSLLILSPYCLLSGFLLTFFCTTLKGAKERLIGQLYLYDTAGGALGGLLFGAVFSALLSPLQSLALVSAIGCVTGGGLAVAFLKSGERRIALSGILLALLATTSAVAFSGSLEKTSLSWLMKGKPLVEYRHTPYGTLSVFKEGDQFNFFENGVPAASTNDAIAAESAVHFAMAQHPAPRNVLLVSGGLNGACPEIEKYPSVQNIDYVELDPAVIQLTEKYVGKSPKVHPIVDDARHFISSKRAAYDVIVMSLPDPVNYQLNRYYTAEFFTLVKDALSEGGVFGFQVGSAANYINAQDRLLLSSINRALRSTFKHGLFIPGPRIAVLGSSRDLSLDVPRLLSEKGISTRFVNQNYLDSMLTPDRVKAIAAIIQQPGNMNRDFYPVGVYAHLNRWTEQFGLGILAPSSMVLLISFFIALLILSQPRREISISVSTTAFAGMGLQIVLIIAFQAFFGILYQQIGVLIASFLVGGALGTCLTNRLSSKTAPAFVLVDLLMLVTSAGCAGLFSSTAFSGLASQYGFLIFPVLNAWVGFLVGAQFPTASRLLAGSSSPPASTTGMSSSPVSTDGTPVSAAGTSSSPVPTAARLIALDLIGASAGAFLLSTFLIPSLGVLWVCCFLAFLKAGSSLISCLRLSRLSGSPESTAIRIRDVSFVVLVFVVMLEGVLIMDPETSTGVYAFSFLPVYHAVLFVLAAFGILAAMDIAAVKTAHAGRFALFNRVAEKTFELTQLKLSRWLYFLAFSFVIFFPLFKCYFQIPYVFCHVCPRKCPFGFLRPYMIPAALLMNLASRAWCFNYCPLGTLQSCSSKSLHKNMKIALRVCAIFVLGLTAYSYFKIGSDAHSPLKFDNDWYTALFRNSYAINVWVIIVAALIVAASIFLPRLFCQALCPVGSLSELFRSWEKRNDQNLQAENGEQK